MGGDGDRLTQNASNGWALGWPIKPKMWKINNVPIGCGSIGIDEQKTLKKYILSIKIQPALSAYIIQRKY